MVCSNSPSPVQNLTWVDSDGEYLLFLHLRTTRDCHGGELKLAAMKLLTSEFSVVSAAVNGSNYGALRIGSIPTQLRLRLQPLRLSVSSVKLSICKNNFDYRKTTFIRFQHLVPCALAKSSSPDGPPSSYVAVFFSVLHVRYHAGLTTDEMLTIPKAPFIVIGLLESISVVSGMYAGAMLPGPAIPLLYQTFLVWQLIFSRIILRRSYTLNQIVGCFLVAAGVIVAVTSGSANSRMLSGVGLFWPALMICSCAFQAGASIVKESIFIDAATRIKGKSLDIFVVHSFGSGFQALFVLLLLPILSKLKGVPLSEAPSYFKSGAACFLNIGTNTTGCDGAPLLPILYIISKLLFKISNLNLLKVSNAIVASLAVRSSVPIAIYLLSLPLPYLPKGVSLSPFFHLGSVILVLGLILYNIPWPWEQAC
ncbi:UNVERIFIED_CONTAM: protein CLT2, chloroplastic [Sesamum calycinum]|uniref:Protein CLT2, chloroplastic n=1 Tax=Sesamum calycinum TaxID=2727403 RepID=A0AAW2QM08_9LAMI